MLKYYYGWKPQAPDFRDKLWVPPCHLTAQALPPSVDLRPQCPPIEDQGQLGSCGPNAVAGLLEFDEMAQSLPDTSLPSRLFIYYNTRVLMGTVNQDSGVDNRTMLKSLSQTGYCPESELPYDINQYTVKPSQQCYTDAAKNAITEYQAVAQDLNTMKAAVAARVPFLFGFTVYDSFESAQVSATGDVPMPQPGESVRGGHDVDIVGYDDAIQRFTFRNSWNTRWGRQGYGTFPYAFCTNPNLSSDFWMVLRVPGGGPTPPPSPPPPPPPGPPADRIINQLRGFNAAGQLVARFNRQ